MHYWSFTCSLFISKTSFNQYPPVYQFWADFFIKFYIFNIVRNSLETSRLICVPNQITCFHIGCNNTESVKMYGNLDNIRWYLCHFNSIQLISLKTSYLLNSYSSFMNPPAEFCCKLNDEFLHKLQKKKKFCGHISL